MNIKTDFRVFVDASHSVFLKKKKKKKKKIKIKTIFFKKKKNTRTNKIITIFFSKSRSHFCRKCYDFDMRQKSEKNVNVW